MPLVFAFAIIAAIIVEPVGGNHGVVPPELHQVPQPYRTHHPIQLRGKKIGQTHENTNLQHKTIRS